MMEKLLTYKGFSGRIYFSGDDATFHGRIEGIDDLVSFEGASIVSIKKAFKKAVEDYIIICAAIEKEVETR